MTKFSGDNIPTPRKTSRRAEDYSPLVLAYIGDAIYEIAVRTHLVQTGSLPVHQLHLAATRFVQAKAQSDFVEILLPHLTETELRIFKRGRNAKSATVPKHADLTDYRRATGLEALVGFLYLSNQSKRLEELFSLLFHTAAEHA